MKKRRKVLAEAPAAPVMEPLLNTAQVARYLGLSVKSIYKLALEGAIPSIRIGDRRKSLLRFRRDQLEKALDSSNTVPKTDKPAN